MRKASTTRILTACDQTILSHKSVYELHCKPQTTALINLCLKKAKQNEARSGCVVNSLPNNRMVPGSTITPGRSKACNWIY